MNLMIDQASLYELLAFLGPIWSALAAGFAAYDWFGELGLTQAGENYLKART